MRTLRFLIYGTFILSIIAGCNNSGVYEKYYSIPASGWHKDSTITFEFSVSETIIPGNISLNVRNHISYSYSNLWLFIEISDPGGNIGKDTFEIILADPTGKWMGKGFSGLKNQQVPYKNRISFPVPGIYRISVKQGMREEILKGISDIGIRVEKAR